MRNCNSYQKKTLTNHIDNNIIKYIDQVLLQSRSLTYVSQNTNTVQKNLPLTNELPLMPNGQIEKTEKLFNNGTTSSRIKSTQEESRRQIIRHKFISDHQLDYNQNNQCRQQQRNQFSIHTQDDSKSFINNINQVKTISESPQKQHKEDQYILQKFNENSHQTNRIYEEIDKQKEFAVQIKANESMNGVQQQDGSQKQKLDARNGQTQYLTQRRFTPNFNNGINNTNESRLKQKNDIQSSQSTYLNSQNLESSLNSLQFNNNAQKQNIHSTQTSLEKYKPLYDRNSSNSPVRLNSLLSIINPVVDFKINNIKCNDSPAIKYIETASPIKITNQQNDQNDNDEFKWSQQNNSTIKSQNNGQTQQQKFIIYKKTGTNHVIMQGDKQQKHDLPAQKPQIQNIYTTKKPQDRFSGFSIDHLLGSGRFSEVYLATHQSSGLRVALKVISKSVINQSGMSKQLSEEIKIQYLLPNDNIVKLYTFFQNQNEVVLVLEYCPDGCLYSQLKKQNNAKFTEKQAAIYIKQVAASLVFLHSNSVIHRDIKPENILLSFGQIKLADFSFSVYSPQKKRQTQCGSVVYQSPEIVNGVQYDYKTDVWALGVLAFELCHGQTPWENLDREQAFSEIKKASIVFPYYFSNKLKNFIQSLTRKDPSIRLSACESMFHPWLQISNDEMLSSKIREIKRQVI